MLPMNVKSPAIEQRTARLTVLIEPRKKAVFEELCAAEDLTPSQLVRSLIRRYIEERLGRPWQPGATGAARFSPGRPAKRKQSRRHG
jgi:hypothetical protein